jgi:taurine dioxygenase
MSAQESAKLIKMFSDLATLPEVQLRYGWAPDMIAMWDNGFAQHYAVADYSEPRRMQRLSIAGGRVLGPRPT